MINLKISAQGTYFKFRRRQGFLFKGFSIKGAAFLDFPKSWPDMIPVFF